MRRGFVLVAAAFLVAGCTSGGSEPDAGPTPSSPAGETSVTASPSATPTPAVPAPTPRDRACYRYEYRSAVAPVAHGEPVPCDKPHTAITFRVGELDTVVDGHLVSVDSRRVQDQVARDCPTAFDAFVGGTEELRRLTLLRPVWFTPSLRESDSGANWYRCDVIALATDGELAPLSGRLAGVLAQPEGRDRYAMCGTAEPGTPDFSRVVCSRGHSWRAIRTVGLPGGDYPGEDAARDAGQQPCEDAGREAASDSLNFQWGYEWPTEKQWNAGQTYGLCWIPD